LRVLAHVKRFSLPYHLLWVVVLQEGMWTRFFPAVEQVRPVIFDIIADENVQTLDDAIIAFARRRDPRHTLSAVACDITYNMD
jgi:hypothetical protein